MATRREAKGGTLIVGGGFAGAYVARLLRKLRVVTDWTVSLFFRRDIAVLGLLGHPRGLPDD